MEKERDHYWSAKLRVIELIGLVGAKITMFVCPNSWWSHSIFMLLLLLGPTINILVTRDPPEYLVSSLFEKLSIILLASAWGENGVWSKIWCTFVVFAIILLKYMYESMKVSDGASGLETEKAEVVDENKKELEVEEEAQAMEAKEEELKKEENPETPERTEESYGESQTMEAKEEELKKEEKPETPEKMEESNGESEEFPTCELTERHFTMFAEGIAKPIIERAEAEFNHSEYYKREFDNTREKLEEKEIEVKNLEKKLEHTKKQLKKHFEEKLTRQKEEIKKLRGEVSEIAADLYVEVKESEYYRDRYEEKIEDHEFKLEFSYQQEINDLLQKLYTESLNCQHYYSLVQYHRENNDILLRENFELCSKVDAFNEFEDKIAGLGSQIADLSDKLYIASSTPQLFQYISDK